MASRWSHIRQFRVLSGEIAALDSRDFQRRIFPLMQFIWPDLIEPRDLRSWDRSGVDFVVNSDKDPVPVVVQVKGFIAKEGQLGESQFNQISKSIKSFLKSGRVADNYYLVLNRDAGQQMSKQIQAELDLMVQKGSARNAELWSRNKLLANVYECIYKRLMTEITNTSPMSYMDNSHRWVPYILAGDLPLRLQKLTINQHMLQSEGRSETIVADPVQIILDNIDNQIVLLIGEFGYGKTTTLQRFVSSHKCATIYKECATVSPDTVGANHFLHQLIDVDALLGDCDDDVRADRNRVTTAVVGKLFCSPTFKLTLVLDALDESAPLARTGGLQWLFNSLRDIEGPVVLSTRTEFWQSKQRDFATSFGEVAQNGQHSKQSILLLELLPWNSSNISDLVRQYSKAESDKAYQIRLDSLAELVERGCYETYYSDIPKRPLFLSILIDEVRRKGVQPVRLGDLFHRWIEYKIRRDVRAPIQAGGTGRLPIVTNSLGEDDTIRLAWQVMECAAFSMTRIGNEHIELLSDCDLSKVLLMHPRLASHGSELGIILNSLLIPIRDHYSSRSVKVRFAHRAFQEFFLASYILSYPANIDLALLPTAVTDWISAINYRNSVGTILN